MGIDAFVLRYELDGHHFASQFLISPDFDVGTLKNISWDLGMPRNKLKNQLAEQIASELQFASYQQGRAIQMIIDHLIGRSKGWVSLKTGQIPKLPTCANPRELILGRGEEQWYGPISCSTDVEGAWYIRPVFLDHYEIPEDSSEVDIFQIRWLCFARVEGGTISLHWRGFSYAGRRQVAKRGSSQFPYWEYIPALFEEIERLTDARVDYANLHDLMLNDLWDRYRENLTYDWIDRRIRAESSGVSLSAHAGVVYEIEAGGILNLARTIRTSVQEELRTRYESDLPEPSRFDEVILKTLIKEYGTLSYEFSLESAGEVIFRAHSYFGLKPRSKSRDSFPHLNLHIRYCPDLQQLRFVLDHLRMERQSDESYKPRTLPLF